MAQPAAAAASGGGTGECCLASKGPEPGQAAVGQPVESGDARIVVIDSLDATVEDETVGEGLQVVGLGIRDAKLVSKYVQPGVEVVLAWHTLHFGREVLAQLPRTVKAIIRLGVGVDNVDLKAAAERGIAVANVPHYGTEELADHTLSLILGLARRTFAHTRAAAEGRVVRGTAQIAQVMKGVRRLRCTTVGILGFGLIGQATTRRCLALGMPVSFYDPFVRDGIEKIFGPGCGPGCLHRVHSVEELFETCDLVSIHADANPSTHALVDAEMLARTKPGFMLVNTARGCVIDEPALAAALRSGHVAGAAVDVVTNEPFDAGAPRTVEEAAEKGDGRPLQPLAGAPNFFMTPHTAFMSDQAFHELRSIGAESAKHVLDGEQLRNVCNLRQLAEVRAALGEEERTTVPRINVDWRGMPH